MAGKPKNLDVARLVALYESGEPVAHIARKFGVSQWSITQRLEGAGISIMSHAERSRISLGLTYSAAKGLRAIVDGLLLGDGSIHPKGYLQIEQAAKRMGFLQEIRRRLANIGVGSSITRVKPRTRDLDGRKIHSSGGGVLFTVCADEFKAERQRWYPNGRKEVPADLSLSSCTTLAFWFAGDGSSSPDGTLVIFTNGFSFKEADRLVDLLVQEGITCRWRKNARREPVIHIPSIIEALKFKTLIEQDLPKCCRYKLRYVRAPKERIAPRKIPLDAIHKIQAARRKGTSVVELAKQFAVSTSAIYHVLKKGD